jgi:hypothetical protein
VGRYDTVGTALATTDALADGCSWLLVQYLEVQLTKSFAGSASTLAAPYRKFLAMTSVIFTRLV